MSIRKKLTLALLLSSSLPLIFFIIISFYFSQTSATQNAMSQNLNNTELVQSKISDMINETFMGIKVVSKDPVIRSYDEPKMKSILSEVVKLDPTISSIVVSKPNGDQFVKGDNSTLSNISDRAFFNLAIKGQEEVVSEILISKSSGKPITVLATPLRDQDGGNIIGIVQGTIELTDLDSFVQDLSKDNVNVYILDSQGKMLAHPTETFKNLEERADLSDFDFVNKALSGQNGSEEIIKDGKKVFISYTKDQKTGWIVCSEVTKSIALEKSVTNSIFTALLGLVILVISCVIVFVLTGYAIKPLHLLLSAANSISEGNLTIKNINIKSNDEIGNLGKAFEKMISNLQEIVVSIKQYSLKVSDASNEMTAVCEQQALASTSTADNSNEIVQGTENLNLSINKISSNVTNLDKAMDDINKKSNAVSSIVKDASGYSEMGSKALLKVNSSMKDIQQSVNDTSLVINKLDEHSKAIGNITEVIKGISEQTNLLALNAAIEAARAGEQGKGFAVVADEVRKLAEQSGEAAGQVSNLILGIQKETENAVNVMSKGIDEVKDGSIVINDANMYFEQIFNAIQQISNNLSEVNTSVSNMAQEEKDIATNLDSMVELSDKVSNEIQGISAATEEQVASIEEMTASAQSLGDMAVNLKDLTNKFKTD